MSTKKVILEDIGEIKLTRRKGSTRMSMRVKPDGLITVNYPWFATKNEVESFIYQNIDWIKRHQEKVKTAFPRFMLNQEIILKQHRIKIIPHQQGKLQAVIGNENVSVIIPEKENIESDEVQRFIYKVISEVCRKEARLILPSRVKTLAAQHGFTYNKVFVKNLKSKWGSCSTLGNINLNVHLMRMPDHLIDYIILHELTHTVEMNHSRNFWQKLNEICDGKARILDKAMKAEGRNILLPH